MDIRIEAIEIKITPDEVRDLIKGNALPIEKIMNGIHTDAILNNEAEPAPEEPEAEEAPETKAEAKKTEAPKVLTPAETAPDSIKFVDVAEPEQPTPEVKLAPTPEAKTYTLQDVRDAMERVRNKFEYGTPAPGEEKGPNEEMDEKLHKQLTKLFKETAKRVGEADKPSALAEDKREDFIKAIENFVLTGNDVTPF